jgi:alpha-methylacyl-CoA racemase
MLLAFGVMCAVFERQSSGRGQVVDASILQGATLLMSLFYASIASTDWPMVRGSGRLDGAAPYYRVYETADGQFMAVGAVERLFYAEFVSKLGFSIDSLPDRNDSRNWPELIRQFSERFRSKSRSEWATIFDGSDGCVTPVLTPAEAPLHPQHSSSKNFAPWREGYIVGPAPTFDRSKPDSYHDSKPGDGIGVLASWGVPIHSLDGLIA